MPYFIDTPYKQRVLYAEDLEQYRRAKSLYASARRNGSLNKEAVVYVSNNLHVTLAEAGHLVRTDITNLDSFEWAR